MANMLTTPGDAFCSQLFIIGALTNGQQEYHGILINGMHGTHLYDPFNTTNVIGNLELGLQTGSSRERPAGGAAVINGQLAYFASGDGMF